MTPESLADLEAKLGAMTEGPWQADTHQANEHPDSWWDAYVVRPGMSPVRVGTTGLQPRGIAKADAEGIAALRNNADELLRLARDASEFHGWLYAVWMAFLADEETHELNQVLRNLSEWMSEREAS